MVQGCTRTKQTFWTEDQFLVTVSLGIREHDSDTRFVEIVIDISMIGGLEVWILEHLKIETRLIDEMFSSVMGECVNVM